MPRLSAAPITLTPEEEQDLLRLTRAQKTPRTLAGRASMILLAAAGDCGSRDGPPGRRLAEGGAPLACALAVRPGRAIDRGAAGGCTAAGDARDVHARADLRDHGAGLRAGGEKQPAAQTLEPKRTGR